MHSLFKHTYIIIYLYGFDSLAKCRYFIMWCNHLGIMFYVLIYSFIIKPQKSVLGSDVIKLHASVVYQ